MWRIKHLGERCQENFNLKHLQGLIGAGVLELYFFPIKIVGRRIKGTFCVKDHILFYYNNYSKEFAGDDPVLLKYFRVEK